MITYNEYMKDSENLHHDFFAQFITEQTKQFVKTRIGIDKLKSSKCLYFNDIIKHNSGGGWLWDASPFNTTLAKEAGMIHINTPSVHTCVGKACARILLKMEIENEQTA
jgi:hypothetical protein